MIKIRYLILTTILLVTSFSCCKDDDDSPPGDSDSFSEYFTCKINGVEFNPQGTFTCNNMSFYYYQEAVGGVPAGSMVIVGHDCPSKRAVYLRFEGMSHQTGNLTFVNPTYADSCFPAYSYSDGGEIPNFVVFENLVSGSMNITTFTPRDSITEKLGKIEGTFEFSVANEENDSIIHITDGAFRFKVPNIW